jgi:uncharacterized membrane protein
MIGSDARAAAAGHHHPVTASKRVFRARIWLASAMWVPVLAANLAAIVLALLLPQLDRRLDDAGSVPITVAAAQQIFGALAAGMIAFAGITFSAVFVAAQIQTSSYSPRLAARLRRDPVIITGLALPTATATYALFALAAIGRTTDGSGRAGVPAATVIAGLILLVVTLGGFVALVQRAFDLTQIGGILRGLMARANAAIEDVHPVAAGLRNVAGLAPAGGSAAEIAHAGRSGVVAAVDRAALVRLARQTGGFVDVLVRVGQYVPTGMATLRVHGGDAPPAPDEARRVLMLARQRTIDQDPAFALRILVDIAIRALSPAINDPTTAVQVLDRIEDVLVDLHRRRPGPTLVLDDDGAPRGRVPAPTWTEYLELGLTEIRHYGAQSIQIARRLRAAYDRLGEEAAGEEAARVELERRLLDEALDARFPDARERALAALPDRMGLGAGS